MQLKKITLCGFKSFADKTEFDFTDGVTVVVGPNGCGKSNIVDAVRWVLGEQSAKSLRGGQMLDVIFNGTNTRKSMGVAEVTLTFANTKGMLNVDMEEISVTRKLYRSGESEYLLNTKPCRLKDIREMFMDTGVGADAYSIIEQGKVTSLLQTSKQDRRAIFEEAAGISKYKSRKKEALRKLERTEQNLLRLTDVIDELEKRLRSIKYQAGKARHYQEYSTRLKELRLNQFLAEYHQLSQDQGQKQAVLTQTQDELVGLTTSTEKIQGRLGWVDHEIDQQESEIRDTESQLLQCTSQIGNQEDRIELGHRRSAELQESVNKNRQQLRLLRQQSRDLQQQIGSNRQELATAEAQAAQRQNELALLQESRQEQALRLGEYRAQLEDEKSGLIDIVRRTAQLHNEIRSLDLRRDNLTGQKDRLYDRSGKISREMEENLSQRAQLQERQEKIETLLGDSQERLETTRHQLSQLQQAQRNCQENLSAAKEYRSGLVSRQQLLADLEANLEGVDQGVRQILQAKSENSENHYYVKGMVADLLQADVKYAAMVEAALKDTAQYLVATSSQAVLEDSEKLEGLKGRVQFICLDKLPAFHNGYDFSQHGEVQLRLMDVIRVSPENERLALHLLGKTVLVDTIDAAVRLAQVAPQGYRWVSLNGEVLEADGTLHMGPQNTQTGLISRKSELRQLEVNLKDADERIAELQNQSRQYAGQAEHLERNLQELRTAIYETNTEKVEARSHLEQIDQNLRRLQQEEPLITSEMAALEEQIQESLRQQQSSEQSLNDLESINQQRQQQIDMLEQTIRELNSEDQQILNQITDLKVSLGQTQQKQLALKERVNSVQLQLQQVQHTIRTLENDVNNGQNNLEASQRDILIAEGKISELFLARQNHQAANRQLREKREALQNEKKALAGQAAEELTRKEQLQEQLHAVQLQLNENRLRAENLTQRAGEELGLNLPERYESYEHEQMDWDAVAAEIGDLREKIERLGNINLDAIAEQEELEQRLTYLTGQRNDLQDARRQLEQLIHKINAESEQRFRENFETIRENIAELIRKLFGGGRAEIVLEDPDNILECGIEIIARPPGKQLQSISLLSGGEKTMTAVALLMAIFKSKPSPFCLLDEVDAALDEANIERFNLVVQEFLAESQFVIITHSRRTMSIADIIYGITMQEQGVSRKVSVRFAGHDEVENGSAVA